MTSRYDSFSLLTYVHHPTLHLRHTVASSTSTTATSTIANQTISSVSIFSMPTRVTCRLYDHRSQHLTTVLSLPIIEQTLVRCPVPYDVRDKVLKRHYHGVTDKVKADKFKDNARGGKDGGSVNSALRGGPISSSLSSENQHQQRLRYEAVNSEIKVRLVWSTASSSTSPTSSTTSKSSLSSSAATSIKSSIGSPATNNRYHQHRRVMLSSATTATTATTTTTTTKLANIFSRNNSMRVKSKFNDKSHPRPSPLYPVCALPHLTTLPERPPSQHRPFSPLLDTGRGEKGTPLPGWSTAFGPDRHGSPSSKYPNMSPQLPPQQEQQQQPYGIAICSATFRGGGGGGYSSNSNNNSTDSDAVDDYLYRKQVHIST